MTISEAVDPVMLPIAYGVAVLAVVWLMRHVALGYRTAPKRVPITIRADGRPGRLGPKALLWVAPSGVAAIVIALGAAVFTAPKQMGDHVFLTLVMLTIAEMTWFVGWAADRQIELARKMTYRIAPSRLVRVFLPIFATVAAAVFVSARH